MDQMAVNIEESGTVGLSAHNVRLPDLLEHGLGGHRRSFGWLFAYLFQSLPRPEAGC